MLKNLLLFLRQVGFLLYNYFVFSPVIDTPAKQQNFADCFKRDR